jgi:hypothetical protein
MHTFRITLSVDCQFYLLIIFSASSTLSTFTMISVESVICGTGRSSMTTLPGPLKTTAFMVSLPIVGQAMMLVISFRNIPSKCI